MYRPDARIVIHPPGDPKLRAFCEGAYRVMPPQPYLQRNHAIVDASEILFALPLEAERELQRSGTWATIRYARKRGVEVRIF